MRLPETDSLPPNNPEAEIALLGACLVDSAVAGTLEPRHFYDPKRQLIARILRTKARDGLAPDRLALQTILESKEEFAGVDLYQLLLSCELACPSAGNAPAWQAELKRLFRSRSLLSTITRAAGLALEDPDAAEADLRESLSRMQAQGVSDKPKQWFMFHTPQECRDFQPPVGFMLVGDCHIVRGAVTVIGGAPGTGKSRAAVALGVAGATGQEWFGLKVHSKFKTLILQAENGRHRLKSEFAELVDPALNAWIRISDRPEYGLAFDSPEFRRELALYCDDFGPDVIVLDPWNGIVRDDKQRDFREAFENIRAALPAGDKAPAIVIVAHTRKPKADDRRNGRALLHELSGSHALGSVPRSVFVMQAGSDDETDDRIIWTCCKNNDGALGPRSAWHRRNGMFALCMDFDWDSFDGLGGGSRESITKDDLQDLFSGGRELTRKRATEELVEATSYKHAACYRALSKGGRFSANIKEDDNGLLSWVA